MLLTSKGEWYEAMERELTEWFTEIRGQGCIVNDGMLMKQGKKLGQKWGIPDFLYSPAWLNRFKKRNGLTTVPVEFEKRRVSNERGKSTGGGAVGQSTDSETRVKAELFGFQQHNVFNFVKTTVAYCGKKVTPSVLQKKGNDCKDKVVVFLCSNVIGAYKLKPLVVGTGHVDFGPDPRSDSLDHVDYKVVRNAQMIDSALREWLHDLNIQMHVAKRRILLLFDSDKCQHLDLKLSNIELLYMPDQTSCVHSGIVQNFKLHYTNSLLERFQSSIGSGKGFVIDLDDALALVKVAWESVTGGTLEECWLKKVGAKLPDGQENDQESDDSFPRDEPEAVRGRGKKRRQEVSDHEAQLQAAGNDCDESAKSIWQDVISHLEDCHQRVQMFCHQDE